jgi:hypothetical protein
MEVDWLFVPLFLIIVVVVLVVVVASCVDRVGWIWASACPIRTGDSGDTL